MSAVATAARRKNVASILTAAEASRLLRRATLGPTLENITSLTGTRFRDWLNAQLELPISATMRSVMANSALPGYPAGQLDPYCGTGSHYRSLYWRWLWHTQPDLLRHRIVYALSEVFVIGQSDTSIPKDAHSNFHDRLAANAFGTFRALLEAVSRSLEMSIWLTYWGNEKEDPGIRKPDENYAREIMQLFTIGLWELNLDGTRKKTGQMPTNDPRYVLNGTADVPTYEQVDISNMARVFTGMVVRRVNNTLDDMPPMNISTIDFSAQYGWYTDLEFNDTYHETSLPKQALYGLIDIPAGTGGEATFEAVMDALTNHPSTAPYFAGRMIRLLVTSNPSPAYVARVASVFRNDGTGQVGNLSAVWRAIFLDQEAMAPLSKGLTTRIPSVDEVAVASMRSRPTAPATDGSPMAAQHGITYPGETAIENGWRHGPDAGELDYITMLNAPNVFGRWPAGYRAQGTILNTGLLSPELFQYDEAKSTDLFNLYGSRPIEAIGNSVTTQDMSDIASGNLAAVVDRLCLVLTADQAPPQYRSDLTVLLTTLNRSTDSNRAAAFRAAHWAIMASPWAAPRI